MVVATKLRVKRCVHLCRSLGIMEIDDASAAEDEWEEEQVYVMAELVDLIGNDILSNAQRVTIKVGCEDLTNSLFSYSIQPTGPVLTMPTCMLCCC
jgi:hypothetical protein